MKISMIGCGNVGKATGIGFYKQGNDVIFHDVDEEKLFSLENEGYAVTRDIIDAVDKSTISFICVPTPTIDGKMDFHCIKDVVTNVGRAICEKNGYHLVVIRSTVLPSTTRTKVIPLLEEVSNSKVGYDYGVCVNPEFLRQAYALQDFLNPYRILIGESDKRSGDTLEKLYSAFKKPIIRTDLDTAEMIKHVANSFLATKISFFNEVYMICNELGLDSDFIAKVVAMDNRIGTYGIHGGHPFEGSCLPKDLEALINFIESKKLNPKILKAIRYVNEQIARIANSENQ